MSENKKTSDASGAPGGNAQLWIIVGFVLLGFIGVRSASRKSATKKPWRPIVKIKFQTNEELALTPPTGVTAIDKMLRKRQSKAKSNAKKPDNWVVLGRAWVRKARSSSQELYYKNAEACAAIALKLNPKHTAALNLKALVHIQRHEFKKARDTARKILKIRTDDPVAWGTLSDAFLELGDYKLGEVAAQRMMDIKPNLPSYIRAAYILWLRGQFYESRSTIKHAYDAGRGQKDREPVAWVLTQGALFHWHEGDLDGANAGFDVAFRYKSGYPPAVVGKARVAMARGKFKLAADFLAQAFKDRPLASTAWLLGDARAAIGDKAGATKAYKLVESIGRREDFRTLALFYASRKGKQKDALLYASREFLKRQDIYTEDAYAWALFHNGKAKEAKKHALRAMRLGTRDAQLWYHAGVILAGAGEQKRGLTLVQKALSLNPHFNAAAVTEAKAMLKKAGLPIPKWGDLTKLKRPKASVLDPDAGKGLPQNFKVLRKKGVKGHRVGKIILPKKPKAPVKAPVKASVKAPVKAPVRPAVPAKRPAAPKAPAAPTKRPNPTKSPTKAIAAPKQPTAPAKRAVEPSARPTSVPAKGAK